MTMVRIVRTDGRPLAHYMRNPRPCKEVCKLIRGGHFPRNGFYRAEFVEPAPLFDVVTYHKGDGPRRAYLNAERRTLTEALLIAAVERSNQGRWFRTVVRATR